jgi:hypothetical protein
MANGAYTRPYTVIKTFRNYTRSEPRFRARLSEGALEIELALV